LLVQWLVTSHVSFAQVENTEFRRFLAFINETVTYVLPLSHHTARSWVMDVYQEKHDDLIASMKQSLYKIHWSFGLWTSPNDSPIMGVVALIDQHVTKRRTLMGTKTLVGSRTGENIEHVFWAELALSTKSDTS
jgi:hypothetical protein